jgi:hypothetical protein
MEVYVTYENATEITTQAGLDAFIANVRATGTPSLVGLESASGITLVFGVGAAESWVGYTTEDESYHSVGDLDRKDMLLFLNRDEVDEFYGEMAIPEADAIAAARSFLATGERPPSITWESDW